MLALRFAGAALLALCGWRCGCAASQNAILHRKALEETLRLLDNLEQQIHFRRMPLSQILSALQRDNTFSLLFLEQCTSLQSLPAPAVFSRTERLCFQECFSEMGHGPCDTECQRLDYYRERFQEFRKSAAAGEIQSRALYPRLGLGIGAMLAIVVL